MVRVSMRYSSDNLCRTSPEAVRKEIGNGILCRTET